MAATMVLGVVGKDGLAQIKVRVQDFKTKLQIKQGTGLYINESIWAKRNDEKARDKFLKHDDIRRTLETADEIRRMENPMKVAPSIRRENDPRFRSGKISFRSSFGALVSDTMRV